MAAALMVIENVTLDGVMQAPGRPDEDTRDGFAHGGWSVPYNDEVLGQLMGEHMARESALLFGRRTYEDFAGFWPHQTDNPFTPVLDARTKYVVSTTLREPLPWANSTLLAGDAVTAVTGAQGAQRPRPRRAGQRRAGARPRRARPGRRVPAHRPPAGAGLGAPAVPAARAAPGPAAHTVDDHDHRRDGRRLLAGLSAAYR